MVEERVANLLWDHLPQWQEFMPDQLKVRQGSANIKTEPPGGARQFARWAEPGVDL